MGGQLQPSTTPLRGVLGVSPHLRPMMPRDARPSESWSLQFFQAGSMATNQFGRSIDVQRQTFLCQISHFNLCKLTHFNRILVSLQFIFNIKIPPGIRQFTRITITSWKVFSWSINLGRCIHRKIRRKPLKMKVAIRLAFWYHYEILLWAMLVVIVHTRDFRKILFVGKRTIEPFDL